MIELRGLLQRLTSMLEAAGVPFMIGGSFASTAHGLPRTTQDLDIVIDPPSRAAFDAMLAAMSPDQWYVDGDTARDAFRRKSMFNAIDHASGWKVDLILRKDRAFSRCEFGRRIALSLLDVPVFVASAEDTIVAKLEWSKLAGGSERQRRDVAGVLATMGDLLDRAYLDHWIRALELENEWRLAEEES